MTEEKVMKFSPDIICTVDRKGNFLSMSDACEEIIGYKSEELTERKFVEVVRPEDREITLIKVENTIEDSKTTYFENFFIHKSGKEVPILWSMKWLDEEKLFFCIGRDATKQKQENQELKEKNEFFKALLKHGSDVVALFDKDLNYLYREASSFNEIGYGSNKLIGTNAFNFIHPDDINRVKEFLKVGLKSEGHVKVSDVRFKSEKGEWRWIEVIGSNQLHNPAINAIVVTSRDVTDRIKDKIELQERKQRFKSLFEHHIDLVIFQNKEGIVVDANPASLAFFGIQKKDIINKPLADLLPAEKVTDCVQKLEKALGGESVRFEMTFHLEGKGEFTFDVAKMPVIVNDEIIGVYSILRDITDISRSNHIISKQSEKLDSILESITDAFFTLDKDWNFSYINTQFERVFRINRNERLGKNIWQVLSPKIKEKVYPKLSHAIEKGNAFHLEHYHEKLDKWLQIKAFPSEEGLSVFLEDITERKRSRKELEKLSLVASKTTNGVMITDAEGRAEWVNKGFERLTGYTSSEVIGRKPAYLLQRGISDKSIIKGFREKRKQGKPFSEEMLVSHKSGERLWILVDVTPVKNNEGEITRYIAIQTDITERKEAEEKQLQMTKDLFKQNRDLQQFTYIVSHNLRSPVASVMGLAEILTSSDKSSETYDVSLDYLKRSSIQLDTVLKDLNMVLSIRDKKGATGRELVCLANVCQEVKAALQEPLEGCGGEVFIEIGEDITLSGNKAYLYSVFYNLLSNSIKYRSPDRNLEVNVKCQGNNEKGVIISFSDNGLGFDVDKAGDNIFKLYKRFHYNAEGRGIGLFLVKTHIEAMDGHIEVDSQVNKGTTFLIYLNRTV